VSIDGVFIHHLTHELKNALVGGRINKIQQVSELQLLFQIRVKSINVQLMVSAAISEPRVHLTTNSFTPIDPVPNFCLLIRKYFDGAFITNVSQFENDRVMIFDFTVSNEIGDMVQRKMIIELMGRNSNIIFTNSDFIIIDAIRRLPPSLEGLRTILPKAKYEYPSSPKPLNPFTIQSNDIDFSLLQGVSTLLLNELKITNDMIALTSRKKSPVLIKTEQKSYFYCFPLQHINGSITHFDTLSELLSFVFIENKSESQLSQQHRDMERFIQTEIQRNKYKLEKLGSELELALQSKSLQKTGELLSANLNQVSKGDDHVEVEDYYNNFEKVHIPLDKKLTPSQNLGVIFTKLRKSKNAIIQIRNQIELSNNEVEYLSELLFQIENASVKDLNEIYDELIRLKYIKKTKQIKISKSVPKYDTYIDDLGISYLVGKNNIQNDYITHKVASRLNYFFHVKNAPGSHVVVRFEGALTEQITRTAANLAALHSSMKLSSSVPVDYTLVKHLKKVSKEKGSLVLLSNQKTIYIDPSVDQLQYLKKK
jgi:predicted ribosome quality control (RQC) complex YloA/Tae2 family protein